MATKKQKAQMIEVEKKVEKERSRLIQIMTDAEIYTLTLDPLIESYLDAFEIYEIMMLRWRETGFAETKRHTNKAGATNHNKHPLAQQVEVWSEKKLKALEKLGLTNTNIGKRVMGKSNAKNEEVEKPEELPIDELALHRDKWRKQS